MRLGRFISITDIDNYLTQIFIEYGITYEDLAQVSWLITEVGALNAELAAHKADPSAHFSNVISITFIIDGGGLAITTGQKGYLDIPFACEIFGWRLLADKVGSIVVDVWKCSGEGFPPDAGDSITGSEKPTLNGSQGNQDFDLDTWTTEVEAFDILAFNVESANTIERVTLDLIAIKL